MYTLKELIIDLKFKFNWTSYIFLCQIWQSCYFRKIWKEEMKQEEASTMWGKKRREQAQVHQETGKWHYRKEWNLCSL